MHTVMMTKKGSTKIVNFMTPGVGVLVLERDDISHLVNMHCFFWKILLYSCALIWQTEYKVMNTKEGSTNIVNFMTPGAWVFDLGCGHIHVCHRVKMHFFFWKFSSLFPGIRQTNWIHSNNNKGRVYQNFTSCYVI